MADELENLFDNIREHIVNGTPCPICGKLIKLDDNSDTIRCQECGSEVEL